MHIIANLCIFKGIASGVFDILGSFVVALGVHVDGTGRSGSQKLLPDLLNPSWDLSDGTFLQFLDCQPEPTNHRKTAKDQTKKKKLNRKANGTTVMIDKRCTLVPILS